MSFLRRKGVISSRGVPQVQSGSGMQSGSPSRQSNPKSMDDEGEILDSIHS